MTYNNENVTPPTPIKWYPEELAWEMTTPKAIVRKFPPFASFQKFLVSETSIGNISRQEVVSMIPPLLMDIQPHMTVLDLCAAPGSKAAQLIELIHAGEEARVRQVVRGIAADQGREVSPDGVAVDIEMKGVQPEDDQASNNSNLASSTDDGRATGLLIANDVDYKRAQMLVHQMKRLNSPNLIVTNHDASLFPSIRVATEEGKPFRYLKLDRILADVPCSGDGTCRKNVGIWRDWSPGNALGLHILQVRVLLRSLQLLKVGGRMVYSTCSMHPVEDEAIIATAIDRCGGPSKVRIIDCNTALPGLKRRPGLTRWNVMDRSGNIWDSWAQVEKAKQETQNNDLEKLSETMFPPPKSSGAENIPLERCMRILSHQQDSGCFFIVVLEKLADIRARPESESKKAKPEDSSENVNSTVPGTMSKATADISSNGVANVANGDADKVIDKPSNNDILQNDHELSNPKKHGLQDDDTTGEVPAKLQMTEQDMSDRRESPALLTKDSSTIQPPDVSMPAPPVQPAPRPTEQAFQPKKRENHPFEEPFKYLSANHAELANIASFYSLSPRFPRDRFMVRNATGEPVKTIYYTSALARELLTENEGKGIRFVHCGVKMFMKQDVQGRDTCRWRIQSEGMPIVESWVGEDRVVRLRKRATLHKLLKEMFPRVAGDAWQELGEIGERVRDIGMGCCLLRIEAGESEDEFRYFYFFSNCLRQFRQIFLIRKTKIKNGRANHSCRRERMVLPLWRGVSSLNLMLPKDERK